MEVSQEYSINNPVTVKALNESCSILEDSEADHYSHHSRHNIQHMENPKSSRRRQAKKPQIDQRIR